LIFVVHVDDGETVRIVSPTTASTREKKESEYGSCEPRVEMFNFPNRKAVADVGMGAKIKP